MLQHRVIKDVKLRRQFVIKIIKEFGEMCNNNNMIDANKFSEFNEIKEKAEFHKSGGMKDIIKQCHLAMPSNA
jgi:hypothetical protein